MGGVVRITQRAHAVAAALWRRAGGRLQWRLVRWGNATFLVGLTGVVLDPQGRVLVLEHRYWMGNACGLPSGYAVRRETWERGLAREVREETGLEVADVTVVRVRSGFEGRIEVLLSATSSPVSSRTSRARPRSHVSRRTAYPDGSPHALPIQ